jgi:hypothetical protein
MVKLKSILCSLSMWGGKMARSGEVLRLWQHAPSSKLAWLRQVSFDINMVLKVTFDANA